MRTSRTMIARARGCAVSASARSPTTKSSHSSSVPGRAVAASSPSHDPSSAAQAVSPGSRRWTSPGSRRSPASAPPPRAGSWPSSRSGAGRALRRPGRASSMPEPSPTSCGQSSFTATASGSSWSSPIAPPVRSNSCCCATGEWTRPASSPPTSFKPCSTRGGRSFAVAHNHPSGVLDASVADTMLTRRLDQAAATIGLRFLGHILVAGERWTTLPAAGVTGSGASARGRDRSSRGGSRGAA